MRERLPVYRDVQLGQMGEVGLAQFAPPMLLNEVHLLRRPFSRPPMLYLPLQRSQLPIGKAVRVLSLQRDEDCLRFQTRVRTELRLYLRPDILKGVFPRSPVPVHFQLTRQAPRTQIFARRLHVHPGLRGRDLLRFLCVRQLEQPPYLSVPDHPGRRSPANASGIVSTLIQLGRSNCRPPPLLSVADQTDSRNGFTAEAERSPTYPS